MTFDGAIENHNDEMKKFGVEPRHRLSGLLLPHRFHGFIFDGLVLTGNVVFLTSFSGFGEELPERTAGFLLLLAILAQFLGALAKTGPLQQRLSRSAPPKTPGCSGRFMTLLIFLHFILFTVAVAMSFGFLGIVDLDSAGGEASLDLWPAIAMLIAGITTFAVWRAGRRSTREVQERIMLPGLEYGADVLLSLSVTIITGFFWDTVVFGSIDSIRGIGFGIRGMVLLSSVSLLFVVFYLPSRYLFLVEDSHYSGTWVRVWLVMLPLAWRMLIG